MYVLKRDHGTGVEKKEPVSFDRITERIVGLAAGLSDHVDAVEVAQKVMLCLLHAVLSRCAPETPERGTDPASRLFRR